MKVNGRKRKKPFARRLAEVFEMPPDLLGGMSSITVTGNSELLISECESVLLYEDNETRLKLCDMTLAVYGRELTLKTFFGGRIVVSGILSRIEFEV